MGVGDSCSPQREGQTPTMTTANSFLSSHPRDIGGLYLILAAFSGGLGHGFSHPIRMGFAMAGPQLLVGSDPPYPVILTAHAILMIFFMAMAAATPDGHNVAKLLGAPLAPRMNGRMAAPLSSAAAR